MIGGTAAWYAALKGGVPLAGVDRRRNIALLRTKKGNIVVATQDEEGRIFLFDKAGNIYYDTENPQIGVYIVDTAGDMFNEYVDKDGEVQMVSVGNLGDMTSITVKEIGGIPVERLQKSIRGFKGGRVVGFPRVPDENDRALSWQELMPPDAPAEVPGDGGRVRPPPMLEDYEVDLSPKNNGGLFGGSGDRVPPGELDDLELMKTLRPGDK